MLWTKYLRPVDLPSHEGFDATVVWAGDTGMGKSEAALSTQLALSELTGRPFEIRRQVVYTREQLDEAIRSLPRYSGIVVDEAVNVLFSRDDQKNSQIIKVLEACRSRNLAIFFCMPDFSAMDSKARNSRIRFWIDIRKVGEGLEFIRKRKTAANPHMTDPWNNWAFSEIGHRYDAHPNFIGVIRWARIPESLREEYVAFKHQSELLSADKVEEYPDRVASFLAWLDAEGYEFHGLKSRAAEYLGVDPSGISARLSSVKRKKRRTDMGG
jgi:hypothetical protein